MNAAAICAPSTLATQVQQYLRDNKMSIKQLAEDVGYSRTTVSRYLSGKYDADPTDIVAALTSLIGAAGNTPTGSVTPFPRKQPQRVAFFESSDARSVIGVCMASQQNAGLGTIIGDSGYGKTYALKHYAKMARVVYIECDEIMGCRDLVKVLERAVGIPTTYGSTWERVAGIREFFRANKGYLLIIDEADKLISKYTQKKMEMLRSIFDQSTVGLVLAGEPRLKSLIEAYERRMENRITYHAELSGLSIKELDQYLEPLSIDKDAKEELRVRACTGRKSCFRLLDRTLTNAFQLLDQDAITLEVINKASDMMPL